MNKPLETVESKGVLDIDSIHPFVLDGTTLLQYKMSIKSISTI